MIKNNPYLFWGLVIIVFFCAIALMAPWISPQDPSLIDGRSLLMPPSAKHLLGTDGLGRDLLSRMIYGARISLSVGIIAVGISTLIGLLLGSCAGFYGKIVDACVMRSADIMLCFPTFFLILAIVAIVPPSIYNIMIVIGLTSWMGPARLIRGEILSLKEREFIQAERALGASDARIIIGHLIPNAVGPVLVNATLGIAGAILLESSLSFLGLGVQPPIPSWGNILIESKSTLGIAWWITLFPGMAILITILGFNFIAEGLKKIIG
ncbi:MAG: ABC transporter permease [Candidatus Omnitrophica bacterium]|jgi:peptide/nickel transport system permease protein|nr:ABC transporter permease [Candidatus Omnitrophota bacterium]